MHIDQVHAQDGKQIISGWEVVVIILIKKKKINLCLKNDVMWLLW